MKRSAKILSATFLIMSLAVSTVFANNALYSSESMSGGGARALAMGSAYTALADDAWSLFWNPSGLIFINSQQAGGMHSERFDGVVDYDVAVYATPRPDNSVWSAGMIRLGVTGIHFTRLEDPNSPHSDVNRVEIDHTVNDGEYTFFAGIARNYRQWRWGLAPKLLFRHLGSDYRAYGLGVDVGGGGRPLPNIPVEAAVSIRDLLGTVLAWEQTGRKEVIPPTLRAGLAGNFLLPRLEARISPAIDVSYRFEVLGDSDALGLHLGLEYMVKNIVALRAGSDDGTLTVGGGLNLKPVSIDYAYAGHSNLGDTHRISITARWGINLPTLKKDAPEPAADSPEQK